MKAHAHRWARLCALAIALSVAVTVVSAPHAQAATPSQTAAAKKAAAKKRAAIRRNSREAARKPAGVRALGQQKAAVSPLTETINLKSATQLAAMTVAIDAA